AFRAMPALSPGARKEGGWKGQVTPPRNETVQRQPCSGPRPSGLAFGSGLGKRRLTPCQLVGSLFRRAEDAGALVVELAFPTSHAPAASHSSPEPATTHVARQLPITLTHVGPMPINSPTPKMTATPRAP